MPPAGAGSRFVVRPATPADVAPVVELFAAVAAEGRWIGREEVDREERHAQLMSALDGDDDAFLVADAAGEVVGHLGIGLRPYGVAELGMMVAAA